MNREQKMAWLIIAAFTLAVAVFVVSVLIVGFSRPATGSFGLFGLAGFGPIIFRKRPHGDIVEADERDRIILGKSTLAGAMFAYMAVGICCMVPFYVYLYQGKKSIPVVVLPLVFIAALMILFLVRSITLLVLYSRNRCGPKAANENSKTR